MKNEKLLAQRMLWPITIIVVVLAVSAFIMSFGALEDLAKVSGLQHPVLFPVIIDGFIIIATFSALIFGKLRPKAKNYAWVTLAIFGALSTAGNALHATNHADITKIHVWIAAVVSAIPPIALLLASHLLLLGVQMLNAVAATPAKPQKDERKQKTQEQVSPEVVNAPELISAPIVALQSGSVLSIDEVKDRIFTMRANGEKYPTGAEVGEWLGMSKKTGERRLAVIREELEAQEGLLMETIGVGGN